MRHNSCYLIFMAISILLLSVVSCNRFRPSETPDMEFATFVKAYTGGIISSNSSVQVQLVSDIHGVQRGDSAPDNLFSFSPSVKGAAKWLAPNIIEFIPAPGSLKPGQTYKCEFRLDKLMKISDKKLRKFPFSFMIATKNASIKIDNIIISKDNLDKADIYGTVILSEPMKNENVKNMISCKYKGNISEISTLAGIDANHIRFKITGLERFNKKEKVTVALKAGNIGFKTGEAAVASIPGIDDSFKVMSADRINGKSPYINIQFSKPIDKNTDYNGIISLSGTNRFYTEISDNIAKIYYDSSNISNLELLISGSLKSENGERLGQDYSWKFNAEELLPEVSIPLEGNILPDNQQLILPFKAVCLKAVDVRVIKIYEDNVLSFLQDNDLNGNSEIRRSGRLVHKETIRLDTDPSIDLHQWQLFTADLSGILKQEPGAIYRIRLSFKKEYSLYGENKELSIIKAGDEIREVTTSKLSEDDIAVWDVPSPYYWDNSDMNWEEFNWEDRDNPLTPSYYMYYDYPSYNLTASDIGVIAKYSGENKLWVAASDILTAKPMYGVDIAAYNFQLKLIGRGKTNTDGLAEIELTGKPFAIIAQKKSSRSYLKIIDGVENSTSRFDVGGTKLKKGLKGFIYGERGVWRPGDTLHITMLLQDKTKSIPDNHPAIMELYTPQGQFYSKQVCDRAKDGFYTYHIPTLADAPTGLWNAYFKVGGATFHKGLRIESLKPNRLKINLNFGSKIIAGGENMPIEITSNWLTGPAASGLAVKADMTLSRGRTSFLGYEEYNFIDPTSSFKTSEIRLPDSILDESGKVKLSVKMPTANDAPGMLTANIVCSVEEAGGDASFTNITLPFSPFSAYVGIKNPAGSNDGYFETDKDLDFKVAVVDKNGKRVQGHRLEYRIFKIEWSWWWEGHSDNLDSYVNGSGAEAIASGNMISGNSDARIQFRVDYPEWGRYLVYVKDKDSGHATGSIVLIDWPSYRGRADKHDPDAPAMLSFATDKSSYNIGEQATVFIPGSTEGKALVSIENASSVLKQEWVSASDNNETIYKFKITEDMAPNFYIHISLVQPHQHFDNELPIRMYGVRPVLVNNKSSHIEPIVEMPDVIHPEETFTLKVREKNGRPMTYTIAIVDEGLLDLTAFKTPDPWNAMYAREALGVKTWDMYDDVIGAFGSRLSPMFSIGGDDSAIVNSKKDNRFNPVVRFMGPFTLKSGVDNHKITLPMYIGSVRVMIVAGRNGAFGNAEKTVPVKSPLMILPTLPRIIGSGEKVILPVNVFALEDNVKNAAITVKTTGAMKVSGPAKSSITFSQPGDKLVRFNLEANNEGWAKVIVSASGSGHEAKEEINIEVRNPNPIVIYSDKAIIRNGESRSFSYNKFASDENESAILEITSFPAIDFNGIFYYFEDYTHTCTEQLAAKGISLIYTKDLLSKDNREKAEKIIPSILQELYSRQLADGGFAYWPGMANADSWVTSMTGVFMNEAASRGYDVNKGVTSSWTKFQNKTIQNYRHSKNKYLNDLDQAYRLYTLALAGNADNASMNRLKESEGLTNQAKWMLASAYSICGKKAVAQELINATDSLFASYSASNMTFGSQLRDKAIVTEALAMNDKIEEALALAKDIAKSVNSGYISTQEASFISVAMKRLAEKSNTGSLELEIKEENGNSEKIKSTEAVFSKKLYSQNREVNIKNNSSGPVFATIVSAYRPAIGQKTDAASNGIKLSVSYISTDGNPISPERIKQGTDFTAVIKVINTGIGQDYTNIALTETIPSGWEIYNERIFGRENSIASQNSFTYNDIRDDRSIWYFDLPIGSAKIFKLKLRAAYEGEFILPSIICEAMYDNKVFARTESGKAIVTR